MCAAQQTHAVADECCGRAGVQRGICCVLEARVVQIVCMLTVAGRPHQRRELWIMDGAEPQGAEGPACKFSMFANDTFDELAAVAGGRRPEAIADEFSECIILGTPFHTYPFIFTPIDHFFRSLP